MMVAGQAPATSPSLLTLGIAPEDPPRLPTIRAYDSSTVRLLRRTSVYDSLTSSEGAQNTYTASVVKARWYRLSHSSLAILMSRRNDAQPGRIDRAGTEYI